MQQFDLEIKGMTCAGCGEHVAEALQGVEGVEEVRMDDWTDRRARVVVRDETDPETVTADLDETQYTAHIEARTPTRPSSSEAPSGRLEVDYDLLVVGGGSAAFAAARKASDLGHRALIVNDGPSNGGLRLGGTCVNVGCVPSKALLRAAEAHHRAGHHPFDGITSESEVTDFGAVTDQVQALVDTLQQEKYLDVVADDPNVEIREGWARLAGPQSIEVDGDTITGRRILVATGARPFVPDIPGLGDVDYLTNEDLYTLDDRPEHLIVVGGGYVGLENAQAFARLGSEVTILQRSDHVLSGEDVDVAEALTDYLQAEGVSVFTNAEVQAVQRSNGHLLVQVEGPDYEAPETITGSHLLVATGRRGNTDRLGLDELGLQTHGRGFLTVDETLGTDIDSIYGAGDVIGDPSFVYTAAYEAELAAENALTDAPSARNDEPRPWVVFTDPQVAGVGVGERQAQVQGIDVEVSTLSLDEVPRALAARDTRGFIKLLREREGGRLVGARILVPEGSELLMHLSTAVQQGWTADELTNRLHPYLTLSEGVKLAALAFDRDVETLSCCAT